MLVVAAYTELATYGIVGITAAGRAGLVEPILSGNIITYKLVGEITRSDSVVAFDGRYERFNAPK